MKRDIYILHAQGLLGVTKVVFDDNTPGDIILTVSGSEVHQGPPGGRQRRQAVHHLGHVAQAIAGCVPAFLLAPHDAGPGAPAQRTAHQGTGRQDRWRPVVQQPTQARMLRCLHRYRQPVRRAFHDSIHGFGQRSASLHATPVCALSTCAKVFVRD